MISIVAFPNSISAKWTQAEIAGIQTWPFAFIVNIDNN